MYRLGPSTASSIIGEYPDIAVYGKMLSGGYMPIAATLTTTETFDAFLGKKKWHALLHGHSFTVSDVTGRFVLHHFSHSNEFLGL
jgi:bifunctional dethiobiotin synthetase / adenosylmethionine---8-amino-7-oxononanoate aminotransferase